MSSTGKSCLCQVPKAVRKQELPKTGCKICSCTGCNSRDFTESDSNHSAESPHSPINPQEEEPLSLGLDNFDSSFLGQVIKLEYHLYPPMLGFGVPQRTSTYILGRPN